jgi:hypothetical protein
MLDIILISKEEARAFKKISATLKDDIFQQYVIEAQLQDVAPLLGERLFNAIMKSPEDFEELLTGGSYDHAGETFENYGLKAVVAHYFYARYRYFSGVTDTPTGFVTKTHIDSVPESEASKKSQYTINRDSAFTIWKSVENYLIRNDNELFGYRLDYNRQPKRKPGTGGFRMTSY